MSGIEISEDMTSSQLEALAGGELLKAEVAIKQPARIATLVFINFVGCLLLPDTQCQEVVTAIARDVGQFTA